MEKEIVKALSYKPTPAHIGQDKQAVDAFCQAYRAYMDASKTERDAVRNSVKLAEEAADVEHGDYLLEPNPTELLRSLLPLYFANLLTQMVLEGKASEQSARMVAMKSATENAKTLIGELTLEYNKARQAQITNELLEITTAMKAME